MNMTTGRLAEILSGELIGNPDEIVTGVSGLAQAKKGDLSFFGNPKYLSDALNTKASAILISKDTDALAFKEKNVIKVQNPQYSYAIILSIIEKERFNSIEIKIHPCASISDKAKIGANAYIGQNAVIEAGAVIGNNAKIFPNVYIGSNVKIGDDALIYPNVVIRENAIIGDRVILQPGSVIGGDGFGFATIDGKNQKIPQIGTVEIGDDVEIGANTTIDRATVETTKIGSGTKIDNHVQIAHNVQIGQNCIIVAQSGIAGSTKIGNNTTIAAQVGIVGHLTIGSNVLISSQSGISGNISDGQKVGGNPQCQLQQSIKIRAIMRKLPEMYSDLKQIKKEIKDKGNV
ncbi:MAG: UDP-3-O-(3-hydroxymyristoyl)glucosamine N-acyltransferase [Endomicrobium sp.]|jgi:UDP-3-O-[3-hydroxymyristoyl] glucosamine N-acyltransferase|nr:UDP-3-O-(3-hydroxymyristoyl)glucosamine N-acyltransferase [Endomicrobium sp.]